VHPFAESDKVSQGNIYGEGEHIFEANMRRQKLQERRSKMQDAEDK